MIVLCTSFAGRAEAQTRGDLTCWCNAWVHGPSHGNDCFRVRSACEADRRARGNSGMSAPCEEEPNHHECERIGFDDEGRGLNLGPTRPRAWQLLGLRASALHRSLGPPSERVDGWLRFGARLAVHLARGRVDRVRVAFEPGTSCTDAVAHEGFRQATPPIRGAVCRWPAISERHRLEPTGRIAGEYDSASATLEVRATD